ncbi:hypothetical protein [Pseudomonas putida]
MSMDNIEAVLRDRNAAAQTLVGKPFESEAQILQVTGCSLAATGAVMTMDLRTDRVSYDVENGIITRVKVG